MTKLGGCCQMVFEASSADEAWGGVVGKVRNSRAMPRRYSRHPLMASVGPLEVRGA